MLATLSVLVLGVLVGVALQRRLRQRGYRYPDEAQRPPTATWWVPPAMGIVSAGLWLVLAPGHSLAVPVVYLACSWVMVALAAIDLDVHRLPDAIQLPAYPALAMVLAVCSLATGDWGAYGRALAGAAAAFALFYVLAIVARGALGFGDVKLAGLLGALCAWLGWSQWQAGILAGFLVGGVVALALLVARRATRHTAFAYGPSMVVGALLAFLTG